MKLGELHPLAKGIILAAVIFFTIFGITALLTIQVSADLYAGNP